MSKIARFRRSTAPDPKPEPRSRTTPAALLISRRDAAALLGGISIATLQRMEARGTLMPVRLNREAKAGQVFYRVGDLVRLAQGDDDA